MTVGLSACWTVEETKVKADKVQAYVAEKCHYLPTIASVTAIILAADPTTVVAAGTMICQAVLATMDHTPAQTLVTDCPRVAGVCVEGEWLKKDE